MSTLVAPQRALPRVESDESRLRRLGGLFLVTSQAALALLVIRTFQLESRTFYQIALLVTLGFLPHALLPLRLRLPAFLLLSAGALTIAVGVTDALWVAAVGVALVAVCHLPVGGRLKIALLLAAAALLAAARAGRLPAPWSAGTWAVLGSMFMFRLALYLHALRHDPVKPTPTQAAAYFLMLPNPVFPLFPVVDFSTFVRSHYADGTDGRETYQTGVTWIARGLVHLLLYRVIYQHLPADPLHLQSLGGLLWYVLGTFLLYLRVSGQFHLIVGVLRLYGFALPETHKLFFLSSSFTDFWRRINIYWKDFMMKLVYYPSFFRLRKWGATTAMVAATVLVFLVTWVLHSYQWFWILGTYPLTVPDTLFWAILGVLVIVTSLREARRGRDRSLGARRWSPRLAGRVILTFTALCVLWSLWSAESVVEWLAMWRAAAHVDAASVALLVGLLAAGAAIAGRNWSAPRLLDPVAVRPWQRPELRTALTLAGLLVLSQPAVIERAGPAMPLVAALSRTTLNERDEAIERRGYYERLDRAPRLGAQGWEVRARRPDDWRGLPETEAFASRGDFRGHALAPDKRVVFLRQPLTTNAWGMRDAPRTLEKPAGTVRLAFLGPSFVMGSGVADGDQFTAQLEERLRAAVTPETGLRYEALNFGAPAYSLLQELATLEESALRFDPDVVVVTIYSRLDDQTASHLSRVVQNRVPIPYPGLDSVLARWHVSPRLPGPELVGLLRVAADDVHAWALRRIADECRRRGIVPVVLALDNVRVPPKHGVPLLRTAADAGFVVLDLLDVYGPPAGHAAIQVAEWDSHPNRAGHARIAERLVRELRRHPEALAPRPRPAAPLSLSAGQQP